MSLLKFIKLQIKKILLYFYPDNGKRYVVRTGIAKGFYRVGGFDYLKWFYKESKEVKFLKALKLKNKVVYDVGANAGMFSLFLASSVKSSGKVYSFEPNPICYDLLKKNIDLNSFSNVKTYNFAIGAKNYTDKLLFDPAWTGTGTLNSNIQDNMKNIEEVKVNVVSMDNFIPEMKIPVPDFVKIDVEGLEYDVLSGMKDTLKNIKPKLFIEIHGLTYYDKEKNIINIVSLLEKFKYKILHVESGELINKNNAISAKIGHIYCT